MSKVTPEIRKAIVAEALSWEKTPYHDKGGVKGAGVDCAMFPLRVMQNVGLIDPTADVGYYAAQWYMHRDEELYIEWVKKLGGIETDELLPGNLVLYRMGRTFCHGAIILDLWPRVIHAEVLAGVHQDDGILGTHLFRKARRIFTL